jgi:hypothetical protein
MVRARRAAAHRKSLAALPTFYSRCCRPNKPKTLTSTPSPPPPLPLIRYRLTRAPALRHFLHIILGHEAAHGLGFIEEGTMGYA